MTHCSYFLGTRMTRKEFEDRKIANRAKGAKLTEEKSRIVSSESVSGSESEASSLVGLKEE